MNTALAHKQEDLLSEIDQCQSRIAAYQEKVNQFENSLQSPEFGTEQFTDERQKYQTLADILEHLAKLNEIGGNSLFWAGIVKQDQIDGHLKRLRDEISFFERRTKKVADKRQGILDEINNNKIQIEYLIDDIEALKLREEESENEFVVVREATILPFRPVVMPWTHEGKDENKFRKIFLLVVLLSVLCGFLIPMVDIPIPDRLEIVKIPERLAKMIKKQRPKPKPTSKQQQKQKVEQPRKNEKKKPTEKDRKKAQKKVRNKGVLAFKNTFADLLDDASLDKLGANANLSNAGSTAKRTRRSILMAQAKSSSGGIRSSSLSRNVAGTGDQIDAVGFSRVESAIGTAVANDRPLSDGPGPARTDEEIQIVFDKYKAALYRIYNRELRVNPTLQGKVILRITIEPDGSVSLCKVESADLGSEKLLTKIVARVKRFNFGAKDGVPPITILYPIDFLPAS